MAVFNGAFPIMPGKVEAARAFANETLGARRSDFEEYQQRRGVSRSRKAHRMLPHSGCGSASASRTSTASISIPISRSKARPYSPSIGRHDV